MRAAHSVRKCSTLGPISTILFTFILTSLSLRILHKFFPSFELKLQENTYYTFQEYFIYRDNISTCFLPIFVQHSKGRNMSQEMSTGNRDNRVNEWSHGLFGCFDDCGECMLSCCCPCVAFGMNARDSGTCCEGCCGSFCGCILFFCPGAFFAWCCCIRPNIRRKSNIPTNCCADFWSILFCPFCALIQERNQCKETQAEHC